MMYDRSIVKGILPIAEERKEQMVRDNSPFDIPLFDYFQFGNRFTGSWQGFQYKIVPEQGEESALKAAVWTGPWCSEKSEMAASQSFPFTEEGLEELILWLERQRRRGGPEEGETK